MNISRIRLLNIRNYEEADISFPATVIVLYGNNGQGKLICWKPYIPDV